MRTLAYFLTLLGQLSWPEASQAAVSAEVVPGTETQLTGIHQRALQPDN